MAIDLGAAILVDLIIGNCLPLGCMSHGVMIPPLKEPDKYVPRKILFGFPYLKAGSIPTSTPIVASSLRQNSSRSFSKASLSGQDPTEFNKWGDFDPEVYISHNQQLKKGAKGGMSVGEAYDQKGSLCVLARPRAAQGRIGCRFGHTKLRLLKGILGPSARTRAPYRQARISANVHASSRQSQTTDTRFPGAGEEFPFGRVHWDADSVRRLHCLHSQSTEQI